jgi:hypothetical protein
LHDVQACASFECMQYTIRNIPPGLDRAIKARAQRRGTSVNQVVVEALSQSLEQSIKRRQLRNMPGEWSKKEAAQFDEFLSSIRVIDDELWK